MFPPPSTGFILPASLNCPSRPGDHGLPLGKGKDRCPGHPEGVAEGLAGVPLAPALPGQVPLSAPLRGALSPAHLMTRSSWSRYAAAASKAPPVK